MRDFDRMDHEPAFCSSCKDLVVVNYLSNRPRCPRCRKKVTFYNEPSLRSKDELR